MNALPDWLVPPDEGSRQRGAPASAIANTGERGGYDSEGKGREGNAVMTLRELRRWLALAVARYHGEVHDTFGRTPAAVWAEKAAENGAPATVANEARWRASDLPSRVRCRRGLTRSCQPGRPWVGRGGRVRRRC